MWWVITAVGTKDRKAESETTNCDAGSEEPNVFTVRLLIILQVAVNLMRGTHFSGDAGWVI
jgi:hypothetical protein